MNAVEIEEAVAELAMAPFDAREFPYAFLAAFGNKATALARLKSGSTNASDVPGGVLQRNHIHLATCAVGKVSETLAALKASPRMARAKCKFVLATDGEQLEAEELASGEALACAYGDVANHFGFFLPLAGITTVAEVKDNPIDIKATGRLNKLYVELIKGNPDWDTEKRRHDLNQFMARLIFCFFAEDTGIFFGNGLFTQTVRQMSDAKNTHDVIRELFRAMDIPIAEREAAKLRPWADAFPYVNGGLFAGTRDVPNFSQFARTYLLRVGELDWKHINPDIFGSMIQGIADENERGSLGMHYTSVPNILKVLDPLFLDDLREKLDEAGDNPRKLLNLRKRIANIRVFDPACGSGNFLVIAYIKMREIEAEIIRRRNDEKKSWIPLTNFHGIEIKDFACETARLSLLIAEFQCDARLIGQREACLNVLPLKKTGQVHCGNALQLDWLKVCPPQASTLVEHDLAGPTGRLALDGRDGGSGETYICGNPPYLGSTWQTKSQKADLQAVFGHRAKNWKSLDYVAGWFLKAADYASTTPADFAFVATNSICQGEMVPIIWPLVFGANCEIRFAHTSFKWQNLASYNAGVSVVIVGAAPQRGGQKFLYSETEQGVQVRAVQKISPYLIEGTDAVIEKRSAPNRGLAPMIRGNTPWDGGHLLLSPSELDELRLNDQQRERLVRRVFGSEEFIQGKLRYCLWIEDEDLDEALSIPTVQRRIEAVRVLRASSDTASTVAKAARAHRFGQGEFTCTASTIVVPAVSSENRQYLPVGLLGKHDIITNRNFALYDAPLWNIGVLASRLHWVWVSAVCGKLETRFNYSNTIGWNTFPVPRLTEANQVDLTRRAEEILLAREAHFPATIADLYEPGAMPDDLQRAHDANDETLERIYIGRRFKNDTERLEKLFDLYTKMTAEKPAKRGAAQA